jgi:hypothetical protein
MKRELTAFVDKFKTDLQNLNNRYLDLFETDNE